MLQHNSTYRFVGTPLAVWIRGETLTTVTVATALVHETYFTWRIETQRYREMDIRLKEEREGVRRGTVLYQGPQGDRINVW